MDGTIRVREDRLLNLWSATSDSSLPVVVSNLQQSNKFGLLLSFLPGCLTPLYPIPLHLQAGKKMSSYAIDTLQQTNVD